MARYSLLSQLALRSIFRNTRRTILTILLIASCLAALMFTDAMVRGYMKSMVSITTSTFLGEAQLHHAQYRKNNDVDKYMTDVERIESTLAASPKVQYVSPRVIASGMVSSSENVSAGAVYGIDGEKEAQVSKIAQAIVEGEYLSGKPQELIMGKELADILQVSLGDRIVVTISQANGGELSQELFRLSGVFSFNDRLMDSGLLFINIDKAKQLVNIDGVHEIALQLNDKAIVDQQDDPFWHQFDDKDIEFLGWKALFPQISSMVDMSGFSTLIVSIIMYILIALGLINTMFMSIYERHYEFGILLAIGTRKSQLFWQIIKEGFYIGLLSIAAGLILGYALSYWGSIHGITLGESMEISGVTLNEPIKLIMSHLTFVELALGILTVTIVACLYPAIHASKLQPSIAMRKT
ncbi:ABC transporter permease [Thalassotalea agarivorans]|uniref:ABC-type transport system, involved in lipoprotein release, permease component n=1 Tax=Thalassotalea agarivorans TaxID=349064 RepID=A0A1H9Z8C2_THASX|nr:FtsX-like permease family protein [Thalassotalea agarivorans]SES77698.1 ABC-type transport system, involved in lipoprotein release, permease component [Thalassotalea agarivorans]